MKKDIDDLIAFISGDVLVTLMAWFHLSEIGAITMAAVTIDFSDLIYKVVTTIIIGFAGGFMGLAGKDCYLFYKQKYQKASRKTVFIYMLSIIAMVGIAIGLLIINI